MPHETIYRSLFIQTLKKELQKHLRTQPVFRQSRHSNIRGLRRGHIIEGIPIAQRGQELPYAGERCGRHRMALDA